ncbi:MAG: hypothetical protein MSC45_09100 [Mobiluncus sp.]|uniref:hypothetical protein n=1 Tax=Mobiluncus sp. TaxID=47293 RepID=UPI002587EF02|nr:hypothetical protein [Mobiluncus sp.]MCI6585206.1 hypothetical protein [Mobiluncus sp.]
MKANGPNTVWGVDFQFDADETGKALKIVSIVDEFTRECIGGMVERSITAPVLREHLDAAPAKQTGPTNRGTSAALQA